MPKDSDREVWRRYQRRVDAAPAPDATTLAAYVEGRLDPRRTAQVERALASHPEALDVVVALRRGAAVPEPLSAETPSAEALSAETPSAAALKRMIARASALIPDTAAAVGTGLAGDANSGVVVPMRRRPSFRATAWDVLGRWSAIAASLLLVSVGGFELGQSTHATLQGAGASNIESEVDALDPGPGMFASVIDQQ